MTCLLSWTVKPTFIHIKEIHEFHGNLIIQLFLIAHELLNVGHIYNLPRTSLP
jgi:hypothetical protein